MFVINKPGIREKASNEELNTDTEFLFGLEYELMKKDKFELMTNKTITKLL